MNVTIFSKENCKLCAGAKDKMVRMGVEFEVRDIEYLTEVHEGWRDDGSVTILAAHALKERMIPMIQIDEGYYTYTEAMKELKGRLR